MSITINSGENRSAFMLAVLEQQQAANIQATLSEAVAAEVDGWHKRAERNLDDSRNALRARRDAMNRMSQQRHIELEAEQVQEPNEEDAVLLAEAMRLERTAKDKLGRAVSNIESARSVLESASDASTSEETLGFSNHNEFYEMIIALLGSLDAEWMSKYEDVLANYIKFFDDLTKALAKLSDAIKSTDKDGNFEVDFTEAQKALQDVIDKWEGLPLVDGFESEAAAEAFLTELGVTGLEVVQTGTNPVSWGIRVDVKEVAGILELLKSDPKMDPAKYNAIISAKDSRLESFRQVSNLLAEKYQRQNQQWDTLAKVLSNSIKEMDEAQKSFVNGL
ncbi:IpaD/SipD/SspD family type III secretion system needle tip protein [Stenotrophomonas sp. B1-1]|uniref:IpaD/SipD/SspD family type III secretion system needle tip protein n=1 Tax=Stenotrophomonas sp. B1-1 TaxID=2710648 RepID=UPI0013DAC8B4|nr:IpaD/SipD/SspD family type III secretion system needle tip protein [Stenotrophomonas sp. B1-1]